MWVERGDGIISFYQRSVDEAYYLLEDMAEYDYWTWTCSRRNQGWGNNIIEQQVDTRLHNQLMALNGIFIQDVEMMRQVQEESFATAQRMVEESTYQVVKGIVFDDEYEPLEKSKEKVQESWEVKEAYEAIDSSSSIELIYTLVIDSYVPFPQLSSYILYEQERRKEFLYLHHHSKTSFVEVRCRKYSYQVKLEDYHDQDPYVVMHVIYYDESHYLRSTFLSLLSIFNLFSFGFPFLCFYFSFYFVLLFLVT